MLSLRDTYSSVGASCARDSCGLSDSQRLNADREITIFWGEYFDFRFNARYNI